MNNDNLKLVFIMRGLPGSGKSTLARQLVGGAVRGNMHSTDTYFIDADGAYRFNPAKLAEFHAKNFQAFCDSLDSGISVVVCDNTNVRIRDFKRYIDAATDRHYRVCVMQMPHTTPEDAAARNQHGVSVKTTEEFLRSWEDFPTGWLN